MPLKAIGNLFAQTALARTVGIQALKLVVAAATPAIAHALREQICTLEDIAHDTENEWDNVLVRALKDILDMDACDASGKEAESAAEEAASAIKEHGIRLSDDFEIETPQQNG